MGLPRGFSVKEERERDMTRERNPYLFHSFRKRGGYIGLQAPWTFTLISHSHTNLLTLTITLTNLHIHVNTLLFHPCHTQLSDISYGNRRKQDEKEKSMREYLAAFSS